MIEDILRAVLGLPPGVNKINKDLEVMRQISKPVIEQLIPWEEEKELEIMALKVVFKSQKKGLDKIILGSIQSIYFEPMVAFAYKDYVKGSRDAMLYCRTRQKEIVYRIKKKDIDVYLNGSQVAIVDQNGVMYGLKSRMALGRIKPYSPDLLSISILDREAGHLFNPSRPHSDVQRAFYLMAELDEEEQGIFLALGLYELVTRILMNKKRK
jgi:hypothetical protein